MDNVAPLVKQYVPPDPAKIQASAQAGKVAIDKESTPGIVQLLIPEAAANFVGVDHRPGNAFGPAASSG